MKIHLYTEMALARDLPEHGLRRGDIVRPVEHHRGRDGTEGISVEVLGATGRTLAVIAIDRAAVEPLRENEVLSARTFAGASAA